MTDFIACDLSRDVLEQRRAVDTIERSTPMHARGTTRVCPCWCTSPRAVLPGSAHTHTCSYARSPHSRTGARHARAESSRVSTRQKASEKSNLDVAVSRLRPKRAHEETQKVEAGFLHRANVACFGVDKHVRHNQPQIVRIVCSLCARAHITKAVGGRRGQAVQWTGIGIGSAESRTVLSTHPPFAQGCVCVVLNVSVYCRHSRSRALLTDAPFQRGAGACQVCPQRSDSSAACRSSC